MTTLLRSDKSTITLEHMVSLHKLMIENDDEVNAAKILDLYDKQTNKNFIVSFTGHFSAGKSSMINALLGEEILPKSPIPTSGNIVEITSDKNFAKVFFNDSGVKLYEKPYNVEKIKDYCKDNESIKKVELSTTKNILPKECIVVDTPGIDAADDADRVMTESSLHLVDRLFYVMDYNHVQSDVNLHFLKQIQEKGISFYIIINQIDKHNEEEIPFHRFEHSIKQTFDQWKIYPAKVYYSSLFNYEAPHSEFDEIKNDFFHMLRNNTELDSTIEQSLEQIVEDHKSYLQELYESKIPDSNDEDTIENDRSKRKELKNTVATIKNKPAQLELDFQKELNDTLKNAYLMPATLRDTAQSFLESQQKDFKIGLFGAKQKTKKEQALRLGTFLQAVQRNIESAIEWKLKDKINGLLTQYNVTDVKLIQFIQQFNVHYTENELFSLLKPGAIVNGDYVLNYSNDLSAHIKNTFKKESRNLWENIEPKIIEQTEMELVPFEKELASLQKEHEEFQNQVKIKTELNEILTTIDHELENPEPSSSAWQLIEQKIQMENRAEKQTSMNIEPVNEPVIQNENEKINQEKQEEKHQNTSIDLVIESINQTIETVESLPGFDEIIDDLLLNKERLDHRSLTIALFGAFSAGKSSFANALLGNQLLPSSPNPTTAVINQISPPTDEYEHGTVIIKLKDQATLEEDLLSITKDLMPPVSSFTGLMSWIEENKVDQNDELDKMYQSYLHALVTGYLENSNHLGEEIKISLKDFSTYVTDETKACYFDSVTLYYDSPLSKLGITLVDTPGADSVNARHTNVAFDYIKQADAILYVTYYNHALSRADKNFLMQLGRVRESFELDKMFFIINAADLAVDQTELKLVTNYVEDQLVQLGIRFPKVYPLSSRNSLKNKLNDQVLNPEMTSFEQSFYQFINEDLASLVIESSLWDIHRTSETLKSYIQTIDLNEQDQEHYRNELFEKSNLLKERLNEVDQTIYEERIEKRVERQLHYVQERIAIRFHEFFKDTFNPTTITESGKKATAQLNKSLKKLLDYTGYELLQEIRAVSLRVESYLNTLLKEAFVDYREKSKQIDNSFVLPIIELGDLETPAYGQALQSIESNLFSQVISSFKGTKAFFVRNEKEDMKEEIYTILIPFIENYININKEMMINAYVEQWNNLLTIRKEQVSNHIKNHVKNNLAMMEDTIDINILREKQQNIITILNEY